MFRLLLIVRDVVFVFLMVDEVVVVIFIGVVGWLRFVFVGSCSEVGSGGIVVGELVGRFIGWLVGGGFSIGLIVGEDVGEDVGGEVGVGGVVIGGFDGVVFDFELLL